MSLTAFLDIQISSTASPNLVAEYVSDDDAAAKKGPHLTTSEEPHETNRLSEVQVLG
jgi:hypothetical protein